jgi:hypothetical protein
MHKPLALKVGAPLAAAAFADGRQSEAALEIARGAGRLLRSLGLASLSELPLANGRRADLAGLSEAGEIWIIEVKSCLEDFRADAKWPQYREFCDRLHFAVAPGFPLEILPEDTGLILADRFGAEIVREAPALPLPPARRKAMLIRFARQAALRIQTAADPSSVEPRW